MNSSLEFWGFVAGILALIITILALLRDLFNFQLEWEHSKNYLKRLLVSRWFQFIVALGLVSVFFWSQYSKIQQLQAQVIAQESAYATQEAELISAFEVTQETLENQATLSPIVTTIVITQPPISVTHSISTNNPQPVPTFTAQPTYTPYPPLPTYTPYPLLPTYTPLPTFTSIPPTLTATSPEYTKVLSGYTISLVEVSVEGTRTHLQFEGDITGDGGRDWLCFDPCFAVDTDGNIYNVDSLTIYQNTYENGRAFIDFPGHVPFQFVLTFRELPENINSFLLFEFNGFESQIVEFNNIPIPYQAPIQ